MSNPEILDRNSESQTPPSDDSSFAEILSQFEESQHATPERTGGIRQGKVITVSSESIFVDVGLKMEGVLPAKEVRNKDGDVELQPGDVLSVSITGHDSGGYYTLSKAKVEQPKDWSSLEKAFADKLTIAGEVSAVVKGGVSVDVGVRAFMPASRSGTKDVADLEQLVGQQVQCKIIKLDVASEDVVVDRRAVLQEAEAEARAQLLANLEEGAVIGGVIRSLTDFGAFIDLGGVDGLLHVTDISWSRVNRPSDVLRTGDSIEVKILKLDPTGRRISLGLKQLTPDPWASVKEKYKVGERVRGTVTKLVDFGVFVELEPGVEGLIHMSELSWSRKHRKPSDVVKAGEAVEVMVLGTRSAERRISLGLKQAMGDPWEEATQKFAPGSVVEGPISSIAKFGAFVELAEGLEGMIHISDITNEKRLNSPGEILSAGQVVKAVVLDLDRGKRRIRLGMKQLEPTPVDEYIAEHKTGDAVTGRIVDIRGEKVKVELGEGVRAICRMEKEPAGGGEQKQERPKVDLSSMTEMLSAKWKQGSLPSADAKSPSARPGEVRSFRILSVDTEAKTIELEMSD